MDNHDLRIYPIPLYLKRVQEMEHRKKRPTDDKVRTFIVVMGVGAVVIWSLIYLAARGI